MRSASDEPCWSSLETSSTGLEVQTVRPTAILGLLSLMLVASPNCGLKAGEGNRASDKPMSKVSTLRILVPAYFYPASNGLKQWERLIKSAGPRRASKQ